MQSDAAHWDRLQELFHLIEKTPKTDRDQVLQRECPDPILRERVLTLVRAAE